MRELAFQSVLYTLATTSFRFSYSSLKLYQPNIDQIPRIFLLIRSLSLLRLYSSRKVEPVVDVFVFKKIAFPSEKVLLNSL